MKKSEDKERDFPVMRFKYYTLLLLLSVSYTLLYGQEGKVAYVNKAEIYQGYKLFQEYHAALVNQLEEADRDNSARIRELDSLYSETLVKTAETSTLRSRHERDKASVNENQLDYVREILERHNENVARCEANMEEVIEQIKKESGYSAWEVIESSEQKKDGVDITAEVLLRLNK